MKLAMLGAVSLLVACKGKAPSKAAAEGSAAPGSAAVAPVAASDAATAPGSAAEAPPVPPKVAALGATLEALLRELEGDARSRKTCAHVMAIQKQAIAVAREVPPGVDAAAWETVNEDIRGSLEGLGPYCGDDPPDDSVELPGLYANYKLLLTLLPRAALAAWQLQSTPVEVECLSPAAASKPADRAPRRLARATPLTVCQQQANIGQACACLASSLASWGASTGLEGPVTCEPAELRGAQAQLVILRDTPADPATTAAGTAIVLLARRGERWSALQVVDAAPDVDLGETPNATHAVTVRAYQERTGVGGTTIWIESQNQYTETDAGEEEMRGTASLTLCAIPTAASAQPSCDAPIRLASWDQTITRARGDGNDQCAIRTGYAYRATLTSQGALTLALERGKDDAGRAGRYQR